MAPRHAAFVVSRVPHAVLLCIVLLAGCTTPGADPDDTTAPPEPDPEPTYTTLTATKNVTVAIANVDNAARIPIDPATNNCIAITGLHEANATTILARFTEYAATSPGPARMWELNAVLFTTDSNWNESTTGTSPLNMELDARQIPHYDGDALTFYPTQPQDATGIQVEANGVLLVQIVVEHPDRIHIETQREGACA